MYFDKNNTVHRNINDARKGNISGQIPLVTRVYEIESESSKIGTEISETLIEGRRWMFICRQASKKRRHILFTLLFKMQKQDHQLRARRRWIVKLYIKKDIELLFRMVAILEIYSRIVGKYGFLFEMCGPKYKVWSASMLSTQCI